MPASACCWCRPIPRTRRRTCSSARSGRSRCCSLPNLHGLEIDGAFETERYVTKVKEQINTLFGHHILKEAARQIDLAASMPGAEEMALFDRIGALIRGEDDRFDLIVFDTAPTGHTLRLDQNARADGGLDPRACRARAARCSASNRTTRPIR